jgi:hypothetical protein
MEACTHRFSRSLVLTSLALALADDDLTAQSGGAHPAMASPAPSALIHGLSPFFNWGDVTWNLGEGFGVIDFDIGGELNQSDPSQLQRSDLVILREWQTILGPPYQYESLIAEIRPINATEPTQQCASFEIAVPVGGFPVANRRQNLVLLLATSPTRGSQRPQDRPYDPHNYPGSPVGYGLWDWPWPGGPPLVHEFANAATDFYVVAAHIVPRTSFQPLVSSVQRLRELRHAVQLLVHEHFYDPQQWPHPTWSTCVAGSSFGGLPTQACLQLWPDEFQSGVSSAFHGNLRGTANDHDSYNWVTALLGFGASGSGYTHRSSVDWPTFTRVEGVDYMSLSVLNRVHHPAIQRPMVLLVADEDPVTHGQDWIQAFASGSGHAQPYSRRVTFYGPGST